MAAVSSDEFKFAMSTIERAETRADQLVQFSTILAVLTLVGWVILFLFDESGLSTYYGISSLLVVGVVRLVMMGLSSSLEIGAQRLRLELSQRYPDSEVG